MLRTLDDWLSHIERLHTQPIALGLDRVMAVKKALDIGQTATLITVGGTNGKGSTCAMLERILLSAGYRVGLYTSPHLLRYNERVRIDGAAVDDATLCRAFAAVEAARGDVPLTYFEFGTLAAWVAFAEHPLDALILEVGLGGRLDAVNAFDTDCAVITSVDLDHMDYLGHTREQIGFEKAGIFRPGKPAVVSDPEPPQALLRHAREIGAHLVLLGQDFAYRADPMQWQYWRSGGVRRSGLAYPALRGAVQLANASGALAALDALSGRLPVSMQEVRRGLIEVELTGRFQVLPGRPAVVLDVAHNPHAAGVLSDNLAGMGHYARTWAVFGMLHDKDIGGVIARVEGRIDHWLAAGLQGPRAAGAQQMAAQLRKRGIEPYGTYDSPGAAYRAAREAAKENDRILAFGSFLTVADVLRAIAAGDPWPTTTPKTT